MRNQAKRHQSTETASFRKRLAQLEAASRKQRPMCNPSSRASIAPHFDSTTNSSESMLPRHCRAVS